MPVYHIVLIQTKEGVSESDIAQFAKQVRELVGKIPGLISLEVGPPLLESEDRSQGFDLGWVAVLESAADIQVYADHPDHLDVQAFRKTLTQDVLAYDLVF